jgi:glutamate dehydrogenase (NADP+)
MSEVRVDYFCSSGPGGQSVNTTLSAVRLTHEPTGVVAQCQQPKSLELRSEKAFKVLRSRVYEIELNKRMEDDSKKRNELVKSGDIGVGSRDIGYMFGQYKRLRNEFTGVLTGKGINWGGSLIRPEATGYGVVYFAEKMLNAKGDDFKNKIVSISGSGNVAQYACEKCIQLGAKVVTMSDSKGYIYDADGIDEEKLSWIMNLKNVERGRISEYANKYGNATFHEGKKPWDVKVHVALPCATQNELAKDHAKILVNNGCIAVVEGANMPCNPEAIEVFTENKILFSPGKASNAGGVATSGLEMSQNSLRFNWTREEVDKKLHDIMLSIHEQCVAYGTQEDGYIDYVKGANIAGFVKVADAMIDQGIV